MGKNQKELIKLAKEGNEEATNTLVKAHSGLIHSSVRRFLGRGYEAEDLFQIGAIGLIKAIRRFDLDYEVQFSTYAVPMIMGEIKRYIRDDGIIKVSRSVKELSYKVASAREALIRESGEEPTISQIAERLGEKAEDVAIAIEAMQKPDSLYAKIDDGKGEGQALIDRIESPRNYENESIDKILISSMLKDFPIREQKIIILRYFRQKTQGEIAKMIGISQVQVSRIEKKVLTKMREKLESGVNL